MMHGDEGGDGGWRLYFVRRLTDLLQQRHTAQRAASHVKRSGASAWSLGKCKM